LIDTSGNTVGERQLTLFYVELTENRRPYRVKPTAWNAGPTIVMFEETSGTFFVGVSKTQSEDYVPIGAGDHVTSETRFVWPGCRTPRHNSSPRAVQSRIRRRPSRRFFLSTNDRHKTSPVRHRRRPAEANWEPVIDGSDRDYLTALDCFADFSYSRRVDGLDQVRIAVTI
jgi:oligopeptidase B